MKLEKTHVMQIFHNYLIDGSSPASVFIFAKTYYLILIIMKIKISNSAIKIFVSNSLINLINKSKWRLK